MVTDIGYLEKVWTSSRDLPEHCVLDSIHDFVSDKKIVASCSIETKARVLVLGQLALSVKLLKFNLRPLLFLFLILQFLKNDLNLQINELHAIVNKNETCHEQKHQQVLSNKWKHNAKHTSKVHALDFRLNEKL